MIILLVVAAVNTSCCTNSSTSAVCSSRPVLMQLHSLCLPAENCRLAVAACVSRPAGSAGVLHSLHAWQQHRRFRCYHPNMQHAGVSYSAQQCSAQPTGSICAAAAVVQRTSSSAWPAPASEYVSSKWHKQPLCKLHCRCSTACSVRPAQLPWWCPGRTAP
jgi:hypothetical protein